MHNKKTFAVSRRGRSGLINQSGDVVVDLIYDFSHGGMEYGYAVQGESLSIFDHLGDMIVQVEGVRSYSEIRSDLLVVDLHDGSSFLSLSGSILDRRFSNCRDFSGPFASVEVSQQWGVIDTSGNWVFEPGFDEALDFDPASSTIPVLLGDRWQLLRLDGSCTEINAVDLRPPRNGIYGAAVERSGLPMYGLLSADGHWVVEPQYVDMAFLADDNVAVKDNNGWGAITLDGRRFFRSGSSPLGSFFCGLARVYQGGEMTDQGLTGGKFAFVDKNGGVLVPPKYDDAEDFSDGIAQVANFSADHSIAIGYVDSDGNEIWTPST